MPPMNTYNQNNQAGPDLQRFLNPRVAFVAIIFVALLAFEIFNYSTTDLALRDLLGDLTFMGFHWSTILALAFCGIDFAGIARLFTPEQGSDEPKEVWYLFGAWLLAATMNAILTWWGVSMAVINHNIQSSAVVDPQTITGVVPIFVAVMVWVIRILIIGTLSMAVDRMLYPDKHIEKVDAIKRASQERTSYIPSSLGSASTNAPQQRPMSASAPTTRGINNPSSSQRPMNGGVTGRPTQSPATLRSNRPGIQPEYNDEEEEEMPVRSRLEPSYHSLSARPGTTNRGSSGDGVNGQSNRSRRL